MKKLCSQCTDEGQRSTVSETRRTRTALGVTPAYWDEDGNYHPPCDPNTTTAHYACSRGHSWTENVCPTCNNEGALTMKWDVRRDGLDLVVIDEDGRSVARIEDHDDYPVGHAEKLAQIIASAPCMLDALYQGVMELAQYDPITRRDIAATLSSAIDEAQRQR